MFTRVKSPSEIEAMRVGGQMLAFVLQQLKRKTVEGISTKELADITTKELKNLGGKPAFLGYQGFPDVLCVSINDEIVHGIPASDKIIKPGDIVSLDFGVEYHGLITDGAISFIVGKGTKEHQNLIDITEQSMYAGIQTLKDGVKTGDIGAAIESVLKSHNYGIVRDLVGHGVGHLLHEDPNIPNYGFRSTGPSLHAGMTIAIEPMATLGSGDVLLANDGWTILTRDKSWAAHFEHTVLITTSGADILTIA